MPRDVNPTLLDRCRLALRPGWARSVLARRIVAGALIIAAGVSALASTRPTPTVDEVVAAHPLVPGTVLTDADVTVRSVPRDAAVPGALQSTAQIRGRTVAGVVGTGEPLTGNRVLTSQLPTTLLGRSDARLVPVNLSDGAITEILRVGDTVDVIAQRSDNNPDPRVLARSAVVAVTHAANGRGIGSQPGKTLVMLAMPESAAHRVAAETLASPITVVVR